MMSDVVAPDPCGGIFDANSTRLILKILGSDNINVNYNKNICVLCNNVP